MKYGIIRVSGEAHDYYTELEGANREIAVLSPTDPHLVLAAYGRLSKARGNLLRYIARLESKVGHTYNTTHTMRF